MKLPLEVVEKVFEYCIESEIKSIKKWHYISEVYIPLFEITLAEKVFVRRFNLPFQKTISRKILLNLISVSQGLQTSLFYGINSTTILFSFSYGNEDDILLIQGYTLINHESRGNFYTASIGLFKSESCEKQCWKEFANMLRLINHHYDLITISNKRQ